MQPAVNVSGVVIEYEPENELVARIDVLVGTRGPTGESLHIAMGTTVCNF